VLASVSILGFKYGRRYLVDGGSANVTLASRYSLLAITGSLSKPFRYDLIK